MRTFKIIILLGVLLTLTGCAAASGMNVPEHTASPTVTGEVTVVPTVFATPETTAEPTDAPPPSEDEFLTGMLADMSVEDKIGQLFMFGISGKTEPDERFKELIDRYRIGNIFIGTENIDKNDPSGGFDTVKRLIDTIETEHPAIVPRLFSVDVEGGSVVRFNWEPRLKAPYDLADADEAYSAFLTIGERLREVGINLDLAPVMDISNDPLGTFLGKRIISSELDEVCSIGSAMIRGLHDGGCLAAAKHFPGHGATTEDSHLMTPVVTKSFDELWEYDLAAFRAAIDAGVDVIMAAHVLVPALDENDTVCVSFPILTELLRGKMGYDGVIITDALSMGGLTSKYTVEEAAVRFILAGGDLLLMAADAEAQENVILAVRDAIETGAVSLERLDKSVLRILKLKLWCGIL